MEENTQKGCLIGCLSSVGILVGIMMLTFAMIAFCIRGCTTMNNSDMSNAMDKLAETRPQDEVPYKKTWLSGKGGEDSVHVLKIRLRGIISESLQRNIFDPTEDTGAPTALRKIRAATKDKTIRGLYFDIDSPGGGVTMSDELHDAICRFRQSNTNRFVFVHMGDLCCSGGYYAAAPATCIMARPTTLTGSIGVIMSSVNIAELARKIGLEGVTIASGDNKDLLNPLKPVDTNHIAILKRPISQLHERFVSIVAKGRNLPLETVRQLADGRIFSAEDALREKLIDDIGHEAEAMKQIKKLAGGDVRIYGYREKPNFQSLFDSILLFESADGLIRKMKAALDEGDTPRAEYRVR
jgi:protease-4